LCPLSHPLRPTACLTHPLRPTACLTHHPTITACRYLLPNPDMGIALLTSAAKGLTPRSFPSVLLEVLLGPFMPIISAVVGGDFDSISRKGADKRFAGLRQ
jgi:hypothetical protein